MRLSEAIRFGGMMYPQAFGALWDQGKACALGNAIISVFGEEVMKENPYESTYYIKAKQLWPILLHSIDFRKNKWSLGSVVTYLNDMHLLTRSQIADWVEKMEVKFGYDKDDAPKEKQVTVEQTFHA